MAGGIAEAIAALLEAMALVPGKAAQVLQRVIDLLSGL